MMLNNKKNKQHQGETNMNTFTNNGEFVRPLKSRNSEEILKDINNLYYSGGTHPVVQYIEQLLETAGKGNKLDQRYRIQDAIWNLIFTKQWSGAYRGNSDMEFISTYLPQDQAAQAFRVSLRYYRENMI